MRARPGPDPRAARSCGRPRWHRTAREALLERLQSVRDRHDELWTELDEHDGQRAEHERSDPYGRQCRDRCGLGPRIASSAQADHERRESRRDEEGESDGRGDGPDRPEDPGKHESQGEDDQQPPAQGAEAHQPERDPGLAARGGTRGGCRRRAVHGRIGRRSRIAFISHLRSACRTAPAGRRSRHRTRDEDRRGVQRARDCRVR
jgi:hypothetical protein